MIVTMPVNIGTIDVEVPIESKDIVEAIAEDTEAKHTVIKGINNVVRFMRAVPDEIIEDMTMAQRHLIHKHICDQANRYLHKATAGNQQNEAE